MKTLPLKILNGMKQYSPFYQQVWLACAAIPRGKTTTYGELAKSIGRPGAARAVGRALGANPFAPTVPCHRVIGRDGAMTGYSAAGGVGRKKSMLTREGAL